MAIFEKKKEDEKQEQAVGTEVPMGISTPLVSTALVKPRVSEKAGRLAAMNKYVFVIANTANKISVKRAIEQGYKVRVLSVNIVNTPDKARSYGRVSGTVAGVRKAIVTLKKGDKIDGVTEIA